MTVPASKYLDFQTPPIKNIRNVETFVVNTFLQSESEETSFPRRECLIDMNVAGTKIPVLIDSGSTDCFVGPELIKRLPHAKLKLFDLPKPSMGTVANGSNFVCRQGIHLDIEIGCDVVPITAMYSETLNYSLILGYNILAGNKLIIDFGTMSITRKPDGVVKLLEKITLPPMSETTLSGYLRGDINPSLALVSGSEALNNRGVMAANAIVSVERETDMIPLKLLNLSEKPAELPAHFCVANCEQITEENIVGSHKPVGTRLNAVHASGIKRRHGYKSREQFAKQFVFEDSHITREQWDKLIDLLWEYRDLFPAEGDELGCTNVLEFKITLRDGAHPVKATPYRSNPTVRREITRQVNQMLEDGIIRPSTSNYVSPVLLVTKADGSLRFVTDFRKMNSVNIVPESVSLPRIDDSLDSLGSSRAKIFSTLDLLKGYWQVPIHEDSKKYTAFITHDGVFEYNRMPFGLANSPAYFMRLMTRVLQGLMWETCLVYLDDVIIFSADFPEHLDRLRQVLDRIRAANLSIKAKKCAFVRKQTKFLGHIITPEGILPMPEKVETIKAFPRPSCVREVQSFLGLAGYYRKFIQSFSKIAGPLTDLTQKDVPFNWTEECENAFKILREALINPPVLAYPDYDQPYYLETDASNEAVGFVLSQDREGKLKPIAYSGKRMNDAQKNYSTTEKEAMGVVLGFQQFDSFLRGNKVYVVTDHIALKWLLTHKQPKGRLARWIAYLQQFDFHVIHKAGKQHTNADTLSRMHHETDASQLENMIDDDIFPSSCAVTTRGAVAKTKKQEQTVASRAALEKQRRKIVYPTTEWTLEDLRKHQMNDEWNRQMIKYLEEGELPENDARARELLLSNDQYVTNNGVLYKLQFTLGLKRLRKSEEIQTCLVVPQILKHDVLMAHHSELCQAHFGYRRTYATMRLKYFWQGMHRDVQNWVLSCEKCNKRKTPVRPVRALLNPLPPTHVGERWAMDLVNMPRSTRGNRYILTFTEYNTRFVEAFALPNSKTETIAKVLVDEICFRYGAPGCLLSDLGANLISSVVAETCRLFQIDRVHTAPYRPQTNGLIEKVQATICKNLAMYVNPKHTDWDVYLKAVCYAYNTTMCTESTQFVPFYLMYGRLPLNPIDTIVLPNFHKNDDVRESIVKLQEAREIARQNIIETQVVMKQRFDEKANPQDFEPGDLVWIYFMEIMVGGSKKFLNRYSGPYILLEKVNPVAFTVAHAHNNKRLKNIVHVNRMKRFHHRTVKPMAIENLTDVEVDAHDVEDLNPLDQIDSRKEDSPQEMLDSRMENFPQEQLISRRENNPQEYAQIVNVPEVEPEGINYADLLAETPPIGREPQADEDDREPPLLEPIPPVPNITEGELEMPSLVREVS